MDTLTVWTADRGRRAVEHNYVIIDGEDKRGGDEIKCCS